MRSKTIGSCSLLTLIAVACSGSDNGSTAPGGVGGGGTPVASGVGSTENLAGSTTRQGGDAPAAGTNPATGGGSNGTSGGSGASPVGGMMANTNGNATSVDGSIVPATGGSGNNSMGGAATTGGATASIGGNTSASGTTSTGGTTTLGTVPDPVWITGTCSNPTSSLNFETAEFCVSLSKTSQTVTALKPKSVSNFDFTPADVVASRSTAGYFNLGDITLRVRQGTTGDWQNVTTSSNRTQVTTQTVTGNVKASADLTPALPASLPLALTRSWVAEGGRLILRFDIKNKSNGKVQIGALGLPMVFNNVITNRTLDQAHATCSFADPYIGKDAGYLQVTRLSGQGPALLVLPDKQTPFEAYNPILNAPKTGSKDPVAVFTELSPRGQTFEGFLEWMVHSKAYADKEWVNAMPWNTATDLSLAAGESKTYGLQFLLSDQIRNIEKTLVKYLRPVAVGIPGYILPMDVEGKLYLNYPAAVSSTVVEPAGALTLTSAADTASSWKTYHVSGKAWGRSRLTISYSDGTVQTIHYNVTKAASQAVSDMGTFLTTKDWFVDASDPFGRSPSVMTYDHEASKIVTQTKQAWVCGLGDDGGATWLAEAMKLLGQPDQDQVTKYQQFVDSVVWGNLQYKDGVNAYGVKRTLFYYEPTLLPAGYYDNSVPWSDPTTGSLYWGAWSKAHTLEAPRSYNYPHVAALYWSMYRLARNRTGLVTNHTWDWYLNQAYKTAVAMPTIGSAYAQYGLMDGTVFIEILKDLKREALTTQATDLETKMKARESVWRTENYPFGSEMAWDSTGQEEVYGWTRYFGDMAKAKVCIDAITGYMPAIPHWGYNGCARRYWDFIYGGAKIDRLERMIHHYGSSLNAIPVLTDFRDHPDDNYLLRIGYAGMMGALSNIAQDGFPSMAFHSFPDTMKWDAISGDYGLNFFGHAYNTATYLINHPDFGWQSFGGNVVVSGTNIAVTPLDSFRMRFYVAPAGLWLNLDAGQFSKVEYDSTTHSVKVTLAAADSYTPSARLRVEQPASLPGIGTYSVTGTYATERGASVIPLGTTTTTITLTAK